jgi:hypothetical protein
MGELLVWLFVAGAVAVIVKALWFPALILLAVVALAYGGSKFNERLTARWEAKQARIAALIEHADREHAAIMRGDINAGIYGQYPPAPELADR